MKKILSLVVVALMLAACLPAVAEDFTYPMDGTVDLTWFASEGFGTVNDAYASPNDSPFHKGLSEMTGVNIDWSVPTAGTDSAQALNQVLASATLPDIIFGNLMTDAARHIDEGTIIDLTPYIQEWAPNYYAFLQSNPAYDKAMKTDDGQYYGFGFFREGGGWNDSYEGPVVRQDWLDECGLEAPVTISDWDNVLKVFNEQYGAKLSFTWEQRFRDSGIAGAFGAHGAAGQQNSNYRYFIDEDGKVQFDMARPEWLNYMLKLNEWWEAGLLDQDVMTMKDTETKTKALNGDMGISYTSMGQMSNWRKEADEAGNGANWVGLQYPTADDGSLEMVFGGSGIGVVVSVISGDCPEEKIETAMRVLDYAYSPEGNLYWNFGKQGVSWDYDENGEPAYLPLVTEDPDGLNEAISKYGGSTWSGSCIQANALLYMKNTPESIAANDLWFYPNEEIAGKGRIPVGVTLTAEESDELINIEAFLSTFVPETAAKLITGEMKADEFDAYVEELNNNGLQRALELRQAAYDRFMSR
ncbi:hypothetical protein LJC74_04490 [Eubacteriales bacterium OttesenSCG-928-A19]|nr:hypothetical protein [Eubacteriales bacterium OttesenSCG-928-A19]